MIFREDRRVWFQPILWIIVLGDLAMLGWLLNKFRTSLFTDPGGWVGLGALVFTLVVIGWAALAFAQYFVTFDGEEIAFGFNGCNGRVALESIESVEVLPHVNLIPFGGMGWRFDFGGKRIGFILSKGSAMQITPRGGKWRYTFSCNGTEELAVHMEKAGIDVKRPCRAVRMPQ